MSVARAGVPACPPRFVARTPLLGDVALAFGDGTLTIGRDCGPTRARVARVARHGWRVTARWRACAGARNVHLRATLSADCSLFDGSVQGKGIGRTPFRASPSVCGDGVVDAGRGEGCDDGNVLGGDICDATCVPCDPSAAPLTGTWAGMQENVFTRYGCPNCHGIQLVSGGLDLRAGVALADLINVRSSIDPAVARVVPGDPAGSMLWRKLAKAALGGFDDVPGAGMPFGSRITPDELDAVGKWIFAGAPATGVVPGTELLLMRCRPR